MMCLKKFVLYTFSNRNAFDRLVMIIKEDYGDKLPKGEVHVIKSYREWGIKEVQLNRNSYSYNELVENLEMFYPPFKYWDDYLFGNWKEFEGVLRDIKDEQDIFGKVEVEVQ